MGHSSTSNLLFKKKGMEEYYEMLNSLINMQCEEISPQSRSDRALYELTGQFRQGERRKLEWEGRIIME